MSVVQSVKCPYIKENCTVCSPSEYDFLMVVLCYGSLFDTVIKNINSITHIYREENGTLEPSHPNDIMLHKLL